MFSTVFSNLWDFIWSLFWLLAFIAYLAALFAVVWDLVTDRSLNGWIKAVWLVFLVFVPMVTVLVYLIIRGRGMSQRQQERAEAGREATDDYIRSVAGPNPASEIARGKELLDSGTITVAEFAALKQRVLERGPAGN